VQQFIAGFIVALIIVAPAAAVFLIKKNSRKNDTPNQNTAEKNKKGKTDSGSNTDKIQIEELGKLTGQLAHEIKNPLSTVKVNLKLICEDLKDLSSSQSHAANAEKNQREFTRVFRKIDVLQKETSRLEQILDGFLRYLDRNKLQLSSLDINDFLDDMVDFFSPQAHSHSIQKTADLQS
jgi:signal transduction histidine kinase